MVANQPKPQVTSANTLFLPGMKQLEVELDTTTAMVTLALTSYTIGQAVQPLIAGPLADAIGRRRPMLVAHVMFLVASIACAVSPTIQFLVVARVFQALGGCSFLIVGQAQVGDLFPRAELSEALAFFSLSRMFAAMVSNGGTNRERERERGKHAAALVTGSQTAAAGCWPV